MVLLRRDTSAPVVAIVTYVKAGYFDEPDDVVGISHVLEHMFFKGTTRRGVGEIARETKMRGGYLNAHTIYDHTAYFTVLPSSSLEAGLDIQSDAYANSIVDAGELAKELEVIIQEAKRKQDTPSAVTAESLYELMHDRHRMRRWRIGREDGLRRLTRDDLLAFYRTYYRPRNTLVSIVGDAEPERVLALVEKHYGSLEDSPAPRDRGPDETGPGGFRWREWDGDVSQTQLVMGWRTPRVSDPATPALDMLSMVLSTGRSSRLYRAIRDKQLASGISASNYTPVELGVFNIHAEVTPAQSRAAASAIWSQLESIREHGVRDDEIHRAQRILQAHWLRRFESMDGQAMWLAGWEALGGWQLGEEYFDRMMSLSASEVTDAARKYIDPEQAAIVALRPRDAQPLAQSAAEMKELLFSSVATPAALQTEYIVPTAVAVRQRPRVERVSGRVHVFRTTDGIPILVRRMPGSPMMHATVQFLGGAHAEDAELAGLTLLMSRSAIKGTQRRRSLDIAEELESHGGSLGPSVGMEGFGWSLSAPAHYMDATLELLADVVQEPVFPDGELETERSVLLGEIALARDDMHRQPIRLAMEAAYGEHPYGRTVQGDEATVARIGVTHLRDWHAGNVLSGAVVLAIVADAEEDYLAEKMASAFGALHSQDARRIAVPNWPRSATSKTETRDKAQTAIAVALPSSARGDADRFAAGLVATIGSGLGGRFFDELRDRRSLAYTVHAYSAERRMSGSFVGYIATSPDLEEVALRGLLDEFKKLGEEEVSHEELERAREYTIGSRAIRLQSGGAVLGEMIDAWHYGSGIEELEEIEDRIRSVTTAEILQFARTHFDESRRAVGIVRGTGPR